MSATIRVAVVDDQDLIRLGLRTLIDAEPGLEFAGEAADGLAAVALAAAERPDIVLMDIRMPGIDGIEATRRITGDPALADVRVIVLTTFETDEFIATALQNGASGFMLKDTSPVSLVEAIRSVADGNALLSPSVTRRLIKQFTADQPRSHIAKGLDAVDVSSLTDREREVVVLVGQGMSNDEIAARLVLSPATARTHVSRAMTKLHARDRAQLVVYAYRAGLVD